MARRLRNRRRPYKAVELARESQTGIRDSKVPTNHHDLIVVKATPHRARLRSPGCRGSPSRDHPAFAAGGCVDQSSREERREQRSRRERERWKRRSGRQKLVKGGLEAPWATRIIAKSP